jgi:hypothetical protein
VHGQLLDLSRALVEHLAVRVAALSCTRRGIAALPLQQVGEEQRHPAREVDGDDGRREHGERGQQRVAAQHLRVG